MKKITINTKFSMITTPVNYNVNVMATGQVNNIRFIFSLSHTWHLYVYYQQGYGVPGS